LASRLSLFCGEKDERKLSMGLSIRMIRALPRQRGGHIYVRLKTVPSGINVTLLLLFLWGVLIPFLLL
jgi:hypothetical protein